MADPADEDLRATGPRTSDEARRLDPGFGSPSAFTALPFHWVWARHLWRWLIARTPSVDAGDVDVREVAVGDLTLRTYRPSRGARGSGLLWLHGGGLMVGAPRVDDARCVAYAREAGVTVVSPAYRLAPEHRFPAALDDAHAAWTWMQDEDHRLGIDPASVTVGGASAGAGIAASLAQRLRDQGGVQPAAQLLVYPMLDDATAARRELDEIRHLVWTNRANRAGWSSYFGMPPGGPDVPPYAAAGRCDDLSGLPPAWIGVGSLDLFFDENRAYAERLERDGTPVTFELVDGAPHGFEAVAPTAAPSRAFLAEQIAFLKSVDGAA